MSSLGKTKTYLPFTLSEPVAPLWVTELNTASHWFRFFNWQTQFELFRLMQNHAIETPILYFCQNALPAKMLLLIPNATPSEWVKAVEEKWIHLGRPQTQIFLSGSMTDKNFREHWSEAHSSLSFSMESL